MLGNYLAVALSDLARNRTYAAISILGLAVGIAAALLMAVLIRNHLSYEHFIANHERTYVALMTLETPGMPAFYAHTVHALTARLLRERYPQVAASTRLVTGKTQLRGSGSQFKERLYWADPNAFAVLELPVLAGDLRTALSRPNGIVLSRAKARKYFGTEAVLGRSLQLNGQPMVVTAVIEDLPANGTLLEADVFVSGLASFSKLTQLDNDPQTRLGSGQFSMATSTYVRLAAGASVSSVNAQMEALLQEMWSDRPAEMRALMQMLPIDQLHLFEPLNPGIHSRISIIAVAGVLILLLACINFVNLAAARSAQRALEVGVRRAVGAGRGTIILQFLGEAAVHVLIAVCLGVAMTELALPHVNAFLDAGAVFEYWRDPWLIALLLAGTIVLTLLAGAYPAFVVSAFQPSQTLRGLVMPALRPNTVQRALVILQFASLMGLAIAAGVVQRQRLYATTQALRVATDQVLVLESPCRAAFRAELLRLPGITAVGCSDQTLLNNEGFTLQELPDGRNISLRVIQVGAGTLELLALTPLAGRFFALERGDEVRDPEAPASSVRCIVNEAVLRRLGWRTPAEALGRKVVGCGEVVGVVADFSLDSVEKEIRPTVYIPHADQFNLVNVKLSGERLPQTLQAIDRLWAALGSGEPLKRYFVDEYLQTLYLAMLREAQGLDVFAGVASLLACLGLFALSASTTARRTKEIGIRKAMGAGSGEILRLLLLQFSVPVVCATLIAWPIAGYLMNRWLGRFAYHVPLEPWLFAAAAAVAMLIALLTVATHCYRVARLPPAVSLRSE